MRKSVIFHLKTGFKIPITISDNNTIYQIKQYLHTTTLSHFPIETMKFICEGKILSNNEYLPYNCEIIALDIIPTQSKTNNTSET